MWYSNQKQHVLFYFLVLMLLYGTFVFSGCGPRRIDKKEDVTPERSKEELIKLNVSRLQALNQAIEVYSKSHGWTLSQTESGLYFQMIKVDSTNIRIKTGSKVDYRSRVYAVNGEGKIQHLDPESEQVEIGKSQIISGLNEALLLLHKGDSARFVILPHLAYGWMGDGKVLPGSFLCYELKILDVK